MLRIFSIMVGIFLITFFLSVPSHAWLIYHKPAFKGKVIDAETKMPIEGAVVVVVYEKIVAGLGPGWSAFPFDIREALTDSDGLFQVPSYTTLIQPFSLNSFVNFIIFKPGYGQYHPMNISAGMGFGSDLLESFFSEDFGKEREVILFTNIPLKPRKAYMVTFGVVELPKLKTLEERRKNIPSLPSELNLLEKQTNLIRLINEEEVNLGLQKSDPYKARDFTLHRGGK